MKYFKNWIESVKIQDDFTQTWYLFYTSGQWKTEWKGVGQGVKSTRLWIFFGAHAISVNH